MGERRFGASDLSETRHRPMVTNTACGRSNPSDAFGALLVRQPFRISKLEDEPVGGLQKRKRAIDCC
jgi:hypothetical protein